MERSRASPLARKVRSLTLLALAALPLPVFAQGITDLLSGDRGGTGAQPTRSLTVTHTGRDRVDLSLSPAVRIPRESGERSIGLSTRADLRMICGQYDLKATFQHLLGKEAREEFLGSLPDLLAQQLVGSTMDLLCQAEPTLCNLIQNYSISANLKASYYKDLCQAVEEAVVDAQRKTHAGAVEACLREKEKQGYSLDRAVEACKRGSGQIRDFRGNAVGELDLAAALRGIVREMGMSKGAEDLAGNLGQEARIGPETVSTSLDPYMILTRFREHLLRHRTKLSELTEKARKGERIFPEELTHAVPSGAPPLYEDEVRDWARVEPVARGRILESVATAFALFAMGREIHEVERALEALRTSPTVDEAKREMIADRLDRLRKERERLKEILEDQALVQRALLGAKHLAGRDGRDRIADTLSRVGLDARRREAAGQVGPRGAIAPPRLPPADAARGSPVGARGGKDCGTCGIEYSFGSTGAKP